MNLLFRLFDINDDGYISETELRAMLERLGNEISESDLSNMMQAADTDGDGQISYEEFVGMMNGLANDDSGLHALGVFQAAPLQQTTHDTSEVETCSPIVSKQDDEPRANDVSNRRFKLRRKSVLSIFSRSKKKPSIPNKTLLPRASCPDLSLSVSSSSDFSSRRASSQRDQSSPKISESRPGAKWKSLRN